MAAQHKPPKFDPKATAFLVARLENYTALELHYLTHEFARYCTRHAN
jgi:hypothetical protein